MMQIGFTAEEIQTKQVMEAVTRMAAQIPLEDVENYVKRWDWFHSLGCLLDPTSYRDVVQSENGKEHEKFAREFLKFRRALEVLKNDD